MRGPSSRARITRDRSRRLTCLALSFAAQFTIDELRKQMDHNKNIRNMSVIAHVDHVSIRDATTRILRRDPSAWGLRVGKAH